MATVPAPTIPVNEPLIGNQEVENVLQCLKTGWISSEGQFIREFESQWAAYCGMQHGVAVSSGTAALQIALQCLDLQPGDEVIMPTFTIISCAQAALYNDLRPVLVDAEPRTWCMDTRQLERKITLRTRAIMPVHIYGHPVDMDPVRQLADKYNLSIVEDAAEAHGAAYKGRICGGLGDLNCFSFYANKIITTGEGGMVLTNRADYAEHLRSLRNLCFQRERRFYHTELGHNFRLTNLQAAIGLGQLQRIDALIARKRWMGQASTALLQDLPGLQLPVEESWARNVYWMYGIVLDERTGLDAAAFARSLAANGIITRPFFLGMHQQPALWQSGLFTDESYPVSERLSRQGLYLPSGLALTANQIDRVSTAIHTILA